MGSENILPGISLKDENKQLENIIDIAQENLDNARRSVEKLNEDLSDLREVYDAQDKEGLVLWNNAAAQLEENKRNVLRCEKARKKPYFGRIDFKDPKQKDEEAYYIGRVGIAKNASEPVVIDWRAPIASVYYENSLGPCKYTVSSEGTFEIDLKRKRTYEIADDKLVDFFDSDVVANDELLTKYLAKNKKAVLGEIIATIQQEQNMIIRRSPKTNIIVQGVAGSGKTTVAMHRISYILYNYAEDFRPEDFYIIGSNRILLNYITSVLPELDVYGIKQMTMEQLFIRLLYEDWDDKKYKVCNVRKDDTGNYIKGSRKWFGQLEGFCCEYEKKCISSKEVYMEKTNTLLVGKVLVDTYLKDNPLMSMQSKIHMLNEIIYSKYENEVLGREVMFPAKERKILDKKYKYFYGKDDWKGSIYELYNEFLKSQAENGYDIDIPEDEFDVYDLAALAYIYKRIKETDPVREASHVVIDEAQDFGMMAYCCLHYCLRNCTYTIMGDTSQNIYFKYGLNDWEDLKELVLTGTYDAFGLLRKSYRNTVEISNFATEILRHGDFSIYPVEPIIRHGNPVKITEYGNVRSLIAGAAETITGWQKDGFETIAVVCRDEREAKKVSEELKKYIDIADEQSTHSIPILSPNPSPCREAATPPERKGTEATAQSAVDIYREIIKDNIDYDILKQDMKFDSDRLDEIVDLMLETVCTARKRVRIAGDDYPAELVKSKFMKLDGEHIRFVLDCMRENTTKIRNIKQYLKAALFNAPSTIGNYYTSLVAHDMASGALSPKKPQYGDPDYYSCNEGESL